MSEQWQLRFAPHIGLTSLDTPLFRHSAGSIDPVAQIDYIASLGFAGIEDNLLKLRAPAEQERIGAALAHHGLEMGCFVGNADAWNAPLWGRSDDDARAKLAADLRSSIDAARRVGGKYLTTIGGRDSNIPLWVQHQAMIENLKHLAPVAEKAGVMFGIEPTNEQGFPGMLVHHIADAYQIVKAVDSPAVRLVFDAFHVQVMDGDLIRNLDRTFDAIGIVQIADNPDRLEPGTGEINFVNLFRRLKAKGYQGLVELEHANSVSGIAGEQSALSVLRSINAAI
jgi:hydroxypyruvate isomerase